MNEKDSACLEWENRLTDERQDEYGGKVKNEEVRAILDVQGGQIAVTWAAIKAGDDELCGLIPEGHGLLPIGGHELDLIEILKRVLSASYIVPRKNE